MSDAPRRSTRRAIKKRSYSIGDIVELEVSLSFRAFATDGRCGVSSVDNATHGSVLDWILMIIDTNFYLSLSLSCPQGTTAGRGRILSKLTDGDDPHWLLRVENADQDLAESMMGDVLQSDKPESSSETSKNGSSNNNKSNKKRPSGDISPSDSSTTDAIAKAKASAREERSRRRQALQKDEGPLKPPAVNNGKARPNKKAKKTTLEDVIKVPMLTGTLILYRGLHRRAEFVRKY